MTKLLTTAEAAELLRTSRQTLADWRYRGEGPPYLKVGARKVLYRESEIFEWLEENTEKST